MLAMGATTGVLNMESPSGPPRTALLWVDPTSQKETWVWQSKFNSFRSFFAFSGVFHLGVAQIQQQGQNAGFGTHVFTYRSGNPWGYPVFGATAILFEGIYVSWPA